MAKKLLANILARTVLKGLSGIQQAGALETAAKNVMPCFYLRLVAITA